jgi:putative Mn2+ efflux pump MntP
MSLLVIFFIAIGLSMDAFAVAIAAGASVREHRTVQALRIGGCFGFFQMIMPIVGWLLGSHLKHLIAAFDHWVAFGLLVLIGLKMIHEFFSNQDCTRDNRLMTVNRLLLLSVATSIDALAAGVSFAFSDYPILTAALAIGIITFLLSAIGVLIGCFSCCIWGKRAELAGGIILILIGIQILLQHLRA